MAALSIGCKFAGCYCFDSIISCKQVDKICLLSFHSPDTHNIIAQLFSTPSQISQSHSYTFFETPFRKFSPFLNIYYTFGKWQYFGSCMLNNVNTI